MPPPSRSDKNEKRRQTFLIVFTREQDLKASKNNGTKKNKTRLLSCDEFYITVNDEKYKKKSCFFAYSPTNYIY